MTARPNKVAELLERNPVLLAPMAGVTEAPFRAICKRMGAGLTYTEMVSALGLHYNAGSTRAQRMLSLSPEEVPAAVQISGTDPEVMAEQAHRIIEERGGDVALIDINMGCPVSKVVAKGEGAALMRSPELAATIVERVVAACGDTPVTGKFRKGWTEDDANAVDFALAMESAGAAGLAVHGRTRGQMYKGRADWSIIAEVKQAVSVPVIGSGDVFAADDVVAMLAETGADGVMVARGAQGNPWIFRESRSLLQSGERVAPPTAVERLEIALEHARELVRYAGERAFPRMRKHVAWYLTGMPGATHARARAFECATLADLEELFAEYRTFVARSAA